MDKRRYGAAKKKNEHWVGYLLQGRATQCGVVIETTELEEKPMTESFIRPLVASFVYSLLGMAVFALGFLIISFVCPFSLRKEIEEDQNTALAIVIGSILLGLGIIIAAAIHG
ncbi:MAG: DUF350 domain-containing protein [Polyangiaceae bacterium]